MTMATLIKKNISLGLSQSFRGSVHYDHGSKQADMVLEKEPRVLHLDPQAAGKELCVTEPGLKHLSPQSPPPQ